MRTRCATLFFLCFLVAVPAVLNAQDGRSFSYDSVRVNIEVKEDASIIVEEEITYRFIGEYHKGFRSIPLRGVGSIEIFEVRDAMTGEVYTKSNRTLEKTDPKSWGKFFVARRGGAEEVEWYFSAKDEVRSWVIRYRASGAVTFLKDKDELYWNLMTDFDVSVRRVEAVVTIPDPLGDYANTFPAAIYVEGAENPIHRQLDYRTFAFSADNVLPYGKVTIAAGWPKGIVLKSEYWKGLFTERLAVIVSGLIALLSVIVGLVYWYITERLRQGRGTIIPEYEPPKSLPPAMAEVIIRERVTPKAWAATIIDLAVRGYVAIAEAPPTAVEKFVAGLFKFVPGDPFKEYIISKVRSFEADPKLQDYEARFLGIVLGQKNSFSTRELKHDHQRAREVYQEIRKLERELYKEVEQDTGAFEKTITRQGIRDWIVSGTIILAVVIGGFIIGVEHISLSDRSIIGATAFFSVFFLFLFIKFEARLSKEGAILREEWLGFKLFLETAERHRMQNLTPEMFERFLPYAIIFGVEKKWGRAFDSISVAPPSWYGGSTVSSFGSSRGAGSAVGGFSASAFSSSFASSFSSSFASSGAGGGASGGGGGAGGGGGGGGGGAS